MIPKIQIVSTPKISNDKFPNIEKSSFSKFKSCDSFDFNIIYLNTNKALIRKYDVFSYNSDFRSLIVNINESTDRYVLLILPQNIRLENGAKIKNNLHLINLFNNEYTNFDNFEMVYGENITKINDSVIFSDFFFKKYNGYEVLTKNENDKPTTIKKDRYIITTLDIENEEDLITLLKATKLISINTPAPEWFEDIVMFDDEKQMLRIEKNNTKIKELENDNLNAKEILKQNNEYKSILYKQSDELVSVVFKILEDILDYDLSEFKDVYKEDFLVKLEDITFVGEIKGVNRNVSSKHLSQLDNHITDREDYLLEKGEKENLKPLLIMNTFINKPPNERPDVEKVTIEKAINKYGTLIITSESLLNLYEKYKNGNIDNQTIINRFKIEKGLFIP